MRRLTADASGRIARLIPAEPGEQREAEGRGEQHIRGGGTGEAEDEDGRGDHQCGVEAGFMADAAHGKKGSEDKQGSGDGGWNSGGPVGDSEDGVGEHLSPVEEDGLLQPSVTVEDGGDPVMAGEHFAGDLRVTRFVGAKESDAGEAEEEEKSAESGEQKKLAGAVLVEAHGDKCNSRWKCGWDGGGLTRHAVYCASQGHVT